VQVEYFIHNDRFSAAAKFLCRARRRSEGALGVSTLCGARPVWARKGRDRGRCSRAGHGMAHMIVIGQPKGHP